MADKAPLVSIIVPAYNAEAYLDEALASATGQTFRETEILVVDDGSTDRTRSIADQWRERDARVRVFTQPNRGVAAARNRAIAEARGEFIAPLDADDFWDPTKIERQVGVMRDSGDEAGLAYCWSVTIDPDRALLDCSPRWSIQGCARDSLIMVNYIGCASVPLFRRSVVERVHGYDEDLTECEDVDLSLKVAEISAIRVVPNYLVAYRKHRGSMTTRTARMWRSHARVLAAVQSRRPDTAKRSLKASRAQLAMYLAGVSWWNGGYAGATRWLIRGLRSAITIGALPYLPRVVWKHVTGERVPARVVKPGDLFHQWQMPPTLIPYDELYRRRFRRMGLT